MKNNAKRMASKAIAMLIAITMIVGLVPVTALANGSESGDGYVYLSVSYDKEYISDKNGTPIVYVPVALADIAAVDLTEYGLDNMLYDADGDGEYEITALQLLIYAHEELWGGDWSEVNFTALPGSSYFAGGIFGFTENLVYFLNGDFPVDESMSSDWMTVGATSDRIILKDGDFLDVASFGCWSFLWDMLGGFHLFADEDGNYVHDYEVEAGNSLSVKLMHSFCDLMYGIAWVQETADFEIFYGSVYGEAEGSVITDENGNAEIIFPAAGTYYVWSEGGIGSDDGTHGSCDHYMENGEPCPVSSPAYAKVTVTGETAHTCADIDDDHKCDTCGETLSVCEDLNDDHKCDTCDEILSVCEDLNDDHKCDTCDEILSVCADLDDDHKCDTCDETLSVCADLDDDHKCDTCNEVLSVCADLDDDHKCDTCNEVLSVCEDLNDDHKCDTCGDILSVCEDLNDDHKCDTCGETLSVCEDIDDDHKCDICDETLSVCEDLNDDHKCDTCDETISVCADINDDHKCDICGDILSVCEDINDDHKCDTCGEALSVCADINDDHKCDTCGAILSVCEDTNKNHECDKCSATVGEHTDGNRKDHLCDWCKAVLSTCNDANTDHHCDICGVTMGEHFAAEGTHTCHYCGNAASLCRDTDRNGTCDICGSVMNVVTYAQETLADWSNTVTNTLKSWDEAIASVPDQITSEMNRLEENVNHFIESAIESAISGAEALYENVKTIAEDYLSADFGFSLNLW